MELSSTSESLPRTADETLGGRQSRMSSHERVSQATLETGDVRPKALRRTAQLNRELRLKFPRLYRRVTALVLYIGPRPKVNLQYPKPLLDIDFKLNSRAVVLPLESNLIRATRRFTSPWLFLFLGVAYIVAFAFFSRAQSFITPNADWAECTSAAWSANDGCGLNGVDCAPFVTSSFDFRCPAGCKGVTLQNPRTVGNQQVVFEPLIVGGGDVNKTYRGDSFVCAAAVHAGLFSDSTGGCASMMYTGNYTDFLPSIAHGLSSIGFSGIFPLSYRFAQAESLRKCNDLRNSALAVNVLITCLIFLVLRPRPLVQFWSLVCIGFWHITLFSHPQQNPPPLENAFAAFLPLLFISYALWRIAYRFTMPAFVKAPIEAMILYLGPFWVGVLLDITIQQLVPIDRLLASDLRQRHGAITALIIVVLIILVAVVNQIRVFRKTGWLPYYLGWYLLGGIVALGLAMLPGLHFRLHHYIWAMVLIPGTALPTRLSAVYQGLLLGIFLNGVAIFGFDSILQSTASLQRDAPMGTALPQFLTNSTTFNSSIPFANQTIFWTPTTDWDGFVLLLDDVVRYQGPASNFSLASLRPDIPHFFRLAFYVTNMVGDFTMPATLWPNGTWVDPLPGAT